MGSDSNRHPLKTVAVLSFFGVCTFAAVFLAGNRFIEQIQVVKNKASIQNKPAAKDRIQHNPIFYDGIDSPNAEPQQSDKPEHRESFTVEVSVFKSQHQATESAMNLSKRGFDAFVTPKKDRSGKIRYYVRVGVVFKAEEAKDLAQKLRRSIGRQTKVSRL